jgi:hypothetical protein
MSNYPPGVTGNEYEIAGGNEFEEWFECNGTTTYVSITKHEMHDLADHALALFNEFKRSGNITEYWIEQRLKPLMRDINGYANSFETYDSDCNFSGVVLKEEYQGYVSVNCPKCDKDYEYKLSKYDGE